MFSPQRTQPPRAFRQGLGAGLGCTFGMLGGCALLVCAGAVMLVMVMGSCANIAVQAWKESPRDRTTNPTVSSNAPSPAPITVDLGVIATPDRNQLPLGDWLALQKLDQVVSTHPQAADFAVRWTNTYPSGSWYGRELRFHRLTGQLSDFIPGGTEYRYSAVTPEKLRACVGRGSYATAEDLAQAGCGQAFYVDGVRRW